MRRRRLLDLPEPSLRIPTGEAGARGESNSNYAPDGKHHHLPLVRFVVAFLLGFSPTRSDVGTRAQTVALAEPGNSSATERRTPGLSGPEDFQPYTTARRGLEVVHIIAPMQRPSTFFPAVGCESRRAPRRMQKGGP